MNYQQRGIRFSVIIHAAVFGIIIGVSTSTVPVSKPIVIDFNIEDTVQAENVPQKTDSKPAPPQSKKQNIKTAEQKQPAKSIEPTPSPMIDKWTESPTAVPVAPPKTADAPPQVSEKASTTATANQKAVSSPKERSSDSAADKNSKEEAKKRYLKEHFTYIRDIIMKNLSYPHMARKMGWSGKVLVSFVVFETGTAEDIRVVESSGFAALDRNVVETIKRVCPFPKPPVKAELTIPVVYKLN
ncbi:MAG: energy transducer TonB [Thermodesulfovibrionales bacterium]|nr:energy transducer TonB [Thermodesulfovibrionales bacterium]